MALELIHSKAAEVEKLAGELPGMRALSYFNILFPKPSGQQMLVDRTLTIRTPLRTVSLFPLPAFEPTKATYEEICNARALELLRSAEELSCPLYVFWSGGIDSTLVLVSLLKQADREQKENIIVLMTSESLAEYPEFYERHIRGALRADSCAVFPYLFGTNALITSGHLNDQLFGMGHAKTLIDMFGEPIIHQARSHEVLFKFFDAQMHNSDAANFYLDLFDRLAATAPIPPSTHFEYLWWINFTLRWQSIFLKLLTVTPKRVASKVTRAYVEERFQPFYATDAFQLWSMSNPDKRIKDSWETYKWPCRAIIEDYTKDSTYARHKLKTGSVRNLLRLRPSSNFIDSSMRFYDKLDPEEFYEPDNDFLHAGL